MSEWKHSINRELDAACLSRWFSSYKQNNIVEAHVPLLRLWKRGALVLKKGRILWMFSRERFSTGRDSTCSINSSITRQTGSVDAILYLSTTLMKLKKMWIVHEFSEMLEAFSPAIFPRNAICWLLRHVLILWRHTLIGNYMTLITTFNLSKSITPWPYTSDTLLARVRR